MVLTFQENVFAQKFNIKECTTEDVVNIFLDLNLFVCP